MADAKMLRWDIYPLDTTDSEVVYGNTSSIEGSFFVSVGRMYNKNMAPCEHFL
jgi:hypothetical protein